MGLRIIGQFEDDGTVRQYSAKVQRPINHARLVDNTVVTQIDVTDDVILVNPTVAGATTVKMYNPKYDGYLESGENYERYVWVRDEAGNSATNNITVNDENDVLLATIATNGQSAKFEIIDGVWTFVGRMSL